MQTHCLDAPARMFWVLVAGLAVGLGLFVPCAVRGAEAGAQGQAIAQLAPAPAPNDEAPAEAQSPTKAEPAAEKAFRGRLPAYYRQVVTEEQRQAIYRIQAEYAPKIAALRAQLEALIAEQDAKIQAVLSPEQLKRIEQLREEAKKARDASSSENPAKPE